MDLNGSNEDDLVGAVVKAINALTKLIEKATKAIEKG